MRARAQASALNCITDGCDLVRQNGSVMCRYHSTLAYNRNYQNTSDGRYTGNSRKLTPEDVAEAKRMRVGLKTYQYIAKHFGVSLTVLRKAMKEES